jgi:putative hemolysin
VEAAQALRYEVFYRQGAAVPDAMNLASGRDCDRFDAICDHLLVLDSAPGGGWKQGVVATYRLLRQDVAERAHGFYSQGAFDLAGLLQRKRGLRFLELGRSCVSPSYRDKGAVELLWKGIWAYVLQHDIDVMIGCASLPGTDPERLADQLAFLRAMAAAPAEWAVQPHAGQDGQIVLEHTVAFDRRQALRAVPPLLRAYLRLGAMVSDSAVIDQQFGVTDVFTVLPVASIPRRYLRHFSADRGVKPG